MLVQVLEVSTESNENYIILSIAMVEEYPLSTLIAVGLPTQHSV